LTQIYTDTYFLALTDIYSHSLTLYLLSICFPGATRTPSDTTTRFHGDGVRYKAKLIGVDPVPDAQGDKMCWDSMMKLKGFEAAARRQGKHKQRVWLKVSSAGLKILDERTGVRHIHLNSPNCLSSLFPQCD
uniref:PID domain-containing protein n=1 Tax=Lates calcarifer TaxID=8187 RepID=A0A4W6CH35_LATCA